MDKKYRKETLIIEPSVFQFKGEDSEEPKVCSRFGCGNHLTNQEQLYGGRCISCPRTEKIAPTKTISYPLKNIYGNIIKK